MRKRYLQVNAHSYHSNQMENPLITYNIIIDVQVESAQLLTLWLFMMSMVLLKARMHILFVNNTVQEIISKIIQKYDAELEYNILETCLKKDVQNYSLQPLSTDEIKAYDNPFSERYKRRHNIIPKQVRLSNNKSWTVSTAKSIRLSSRQ